MLLVEEGRERAPKAVVAGRGLIEQQLLCLSSAYHGKPQRILKMIFIVSSHLTLP